LLLDFGERIDVTERIKIMFKPIFRSFIAAGVLLCSATLWAEEPKVDEINQPSTDDALRVAVVLNYAHASLYKIIAHNDKIVLDEEYSLILNNIDLTKIDDKEIVDLLQKLLDTLTFYKLQDRHKEKFIAEYEKNLTNALSNSFNESFNVHGSSLSGITFNLLAGAGGAYANYRENKKRYREKLDDDFWVLGNKAISELNEIRKLFLNVYWKLMKRHNIPDKHRITEKQLKYYFNAVKDEDFERRYRKLNRVKSEFSAYPHFWYYFGLAAESVNKKGAALKSYETYLSLGQQYFREDEIHSSVLLHKFNLNSYTTRDKKIRILNKIHKLSPYASAKNIYSALQFTKLGELARATSLLQINIDNELSVSLNKRLQAEVAIKNKREYEGFISQMVSLDTVRNQDVLYLFDKQPYAKAFEKFMPQLLGVKFDINNVEIDGEDLVDKATNYFTSDLYRLRMPVRWFLDEFDKGDIELSIGKEKLSVQKNVYNRESKTIDIYFNSPHSKEDIIENNKDLNVKIVVNHPAYPVTIYGKISIIKKEIDKSYLSKKYTEALVAIKIGEDNSEGKTTDATLSYKHIKLLTKNVCYKYESSRIVSGCN